MFGVGCLFPAVEPVGESDFLGYGHREEVTFSYRRNGIYVKPQFLDLEYEGSCGGAGDDHFVSYMKLPRQQTEFPYSEFREVTRPIPEKYPV